MDRSGPAARRRLIVSAAALAAVRPAFAQTADAANFPSRPIRIIVPYVAGDGLDGIARLIARRLTDKLGVSVVVENRPGGNTTIAGQALASAPADGYTLIFVNNTFVISPLLSKLPYDPERDFAPVLYLGSSAFGMVVHRSVPANNMQEMLALLRAEPGRWQFATVGSTGIGRLAGELFSRATGIPLEHVPYKGAAQLIGDLVAGVVRFTIDPAAGHVPAHRAGHVKVLAVTGRKRLPTLPEVPTFAEQGLPDYDVKMWYGLLTRGGTPAPIVQKLYATTAEVLAVPEVRAEMADRETDLDVMPPAQFQALMKRDAATYADVIKAAGIKEG